MTKTGFLTVLAGATLAVAPSMLAQPAQQDSEQRERARPEQQAKREYHFRTEDHARLREHYRTSFRDNDKIDVAHRPRFVVGGKLPGDFRVRFHPLPEVIVHELPAIPAGLEVGYVDGYAVVYDPVSLEIIEVLDVWPQ
jgi:Ni/Co efflux regulator RcnB